MDAEAFRDEVESEVRTELDRLGSNKLLLALTDARLDDETVLRAAAGGERSAHEVFAAWADDEPDADARELFDRIADEEAAHLDRVRTELAAETDDIEGDGGPVDAGGDGGGAGAMRAYLDDCDGTIERVAAGLVGRALVSARLQTQLVSYFVNEADESRADLFRDLKSDVDATLETGLDALAERCSTDEERVRARDAAVGVVEAAYEDYAASLSDLGMDPKPVC